MKKRDMILLTLLFLTLFPLTTAYELCDETVSEDELEIIEIIDPSQTNEINWIWNPTEKVDIEVKVRNRNFTTRNFQLKLFFLDDDLIEKNITTAETNPSKIISLVEDEFETLNFSFQLKEPNQNTYYLYAKLYDANNESICTSLKAASTSEEATITIEQEEKIIVIRNVNGPTNITPGLEAKYTVEVINLGNIKEDKVLVVVYNANFKIREEQEIVDLAVEESKTVTFNFTIPANATTQQENLIFTTEYDYNNETGHYYQSSDKVKIFSIQIEDSQQQATLINETENQMQPNQTQNQTTSTSETEFKPISIPYLWPIIITILLIVIIVISTFFFLKYKRDRYMETPSTASTAVTDYVKSIQKQSSP